MMPQVGDIWQHTLPNLEVLYYIIYEVEKKEVVNGITGYVCHTQKYSGLQSYLAKEWLNFNNGLWQRLA